MLFPTACLTNRPVGRPADRPTCLLFSSFMLSCVRHSSLSHRILYVSHGSLSRVSFTKCVMPYRHMCTCAVGSCACMRLSVFRVC